jgi:hypothetical protein
MKIIARRGTIGQEQGVEIERSAGAKPVPWKKHPSPKSVGACECHGCCSLRLISSQSQERLLIKRVKQRTGFHSQHNITNIFPASRISGRKSQAE